MREVTIERCKGKGVLSQATGDVGGDVELVGCNVRDNGVDYKFNTYDRVASRITVDGKVAHA